MNIFEMLDKLSKSKRKEPCYIYRDEKDGQIKEIPLRLKLDSSASALINKTIKFRNPAKLIHEFMFGY